MFRLVTDTLVRRRKLFQLSWKDGKLAQPTPAAGCTKRTHSPICQRNMHGKFVRVAYAPVLDAADIAGITRHSNLGSKASSTTRGSVVTQNARRWRHLAPQGEFWFVGNMQVAGACPCLLESQAIRGDHSHLLAAGVVRRVDGRQVGSTRLQCLTSCPLSSALNITQSWVARLKQTLVHTIITESIGPL